MNSFIEILNQWGGNFLNFAWLMLWQSSLLIVALFAFEYLFRRKVRASIRYALWLVVLVKLCVPPTFALPTSPAWWLHKTPPPIVAKPAPHYTVTYDDGPLPETTLTPLPAFVPPKPATSLAAWLLMASAAISLFLLGWLLVRWWQIIRDIRRAKTSERLIALASEAQTFIGRKSKVEVKLTTNSMSPAVCGLFRPTILIPQSLVENFSDEQLRAVLLHELIHLRRRDVWLNFVQAFLQIFYWWHPLVWLANARIRRVREEAVDDSVMLALRDEAESYAPTLLEVAKLALNRPLASLGLVGILESRHSLRQRIERLVDFHPPRKTGLTLVSALGILAFTAVAVPMSNAPDKPGDLSASEGLQTLTVKVNPEVFLRNVKAHAVNYMHTTNDYYLITLVDILRSEGVDCNPPHELGLNIKTGEMTAKNSPDALEIFRQIIEQLNRTDGKGVLFLSNSSYHRAFHSESILINAQFYSMPIVEYKQAIGILDNASFVPGNFGIGLIPASQFADLCKKIESMGLQPFSKPRIQTGQGDAASLFCGTATNGVHFNCLPYIGGKGVDLAFQASVDGDFSANGTTLVGTANHAISGSATVENHGGIIVCANNPDGSVKNNLVVVMEVQIVTNHPAAKAGGLGQIGPRIEVNTNQITVTGILTDPNFRVVLNAFQQQTGSQTMPEPEVRTRSGHHVNWIGTDNLSALNTQSEHPKGKPIYPSWDTNRADTSQFSIVKGRRNIVEELHRVRLENVYYDNEWLGFVTGGLENVIANHDPERKGIQLLVDQTQLAGEAPGQDAVHITIRPPLASVSLVDLLDAIVKGADKPIKYSIEDYGVVFSRKEQMSQPLYNRHFKIDTNTFPIAWRKNIGLQTNSVDTMAKGFFTAMGVDWGSPPGKAIFYSDSRGELFVKATASDLDNIEQAIEVLMSASSQNRGTITNIFDEKLRVNQLVRDAKLDYERGRLNESETLLKYALALDAENSAAKYYMGLVQTSLQHPQIAQPISGRQNIMGKLDHIQLDPFGPFMGVSLPEVVRQLNEMARQNDPEKTGVDIVILTNSISGEPPAIDSVVINLPSPLMNVKLGDALEAVVQNASTPLKYSIMDGSIVFSMKDDSNMPMLYSRHFRLDVDKFLAAMQIIAATQYMPDIKTDNVPAMARDFFRTLGVDLDVPGKSVFYGDRLGELFVRATAQDLDTIENALEVLNTAPPQIHIKATFIEVPKGTLEGLKNVISVTNSPVLSNQVAGLVGILTDKNFKTVLRNLETRPGVETLAEPEVVTTSGRQTQMRATTLMTVITNYAFQKYMAHSTTNGIQEIVTNAIYPQMSQIEIGPVMDIVPYALSDDLTINLTLTASLTEFLGYDQPPTNAVGKYIKEYDVTLPVILPSFRVLQAHTQVNLWDNQTVVLRKLQQHLYVGGKEVGAEPDYFVDTKKSRGQPDETELLVFITATLVDPAGNRIHADEELPSAKDGIPPQPK